MKGSDEMKLVKGDTIGVFSPSVPITAFCPKRTARAKAFLEEKGYQIKEGSLMGKSDTYRSGSIKDRVNEINELIRDEDVSCLMSAIGGMNSNSLLPYLDYEAFKVNPKIVSGYSDVTAILLAIYAKTGITTFYGPAYVASFGEFPPYVEETYSYFDDIVSGKIKLPHVVENAPYWTDEFIDWESQDRAKDRRDNELVTLSYGMATGRLIGGNLNTMAGIFGTEYMPEILEGDILLIEDSLIDIATVERSFAHFKLAGVFDKVGGIILGRHELFDDKGTNRKHYDVLMEIIGETDIPILAEFNCSHVHPMVTLPIGGEVTLDATNQTITINKI
jgi:muramoyltetrapeptide carboxypeptidase LdcA involved in peptidoglycan recycling